MRVNLDIPAGLCQCGCGQPVPIAARTTRSRGWVKGQPIRYLVGHANRHSDNPEYLAKQFWPLVDRRGLDECWPWLGGASGEGYGEFQLGGKPVGAHRIAYQLGCGPIPDGLFVLHRCDNPPCCNPAHLFVGTHEANMADMVAKGRGRAPTGSAAKGAKLTEDEVREARRILVKRHPLFGYAGLARRYGVSVVAMYEAISGHSWKHVQ